MDPVEKIMALKLADFHRSLATLAPDLGAPETARDVQIPDTGKTVSISFEALPSETLGGLLALPRARVTLAFDGHTPEQQSAFLARFDQAFQRGGG
ncbi:MAG: hypothetical protein ACR2PO_02130 [Methyloligellaceae bacterium]